MYKNAIFSILLQLEKIQSNLYINNVHKQRGHIMTTLIIVLRIIHIFCGVFWAGYALFNYFYLQPTVKALGPDGQKTMQHLSQKTNFLNVIYTAATLTMLSGLAIYWIIFGFNMSFITSGYGSVLSIAGFSGIIAWFIVVAFVRNIFVQMQSVGGQIATSDGPPNPDLLIKMQSLVARLGKLGKYAMIFLVIALLGMSAARFITF